MSRSKKVSDKALNVLAAMTIAGNKASITSGKLERALYDEVNKALDALGGKWDRYSQAHVFEEDPRDAIDRILLTGEFTNKKQDFGFFETPFKLADQLADLAFIRAGQHVLEPSAGRGALAKAAERMITNGHTIKLTLVELLEANRVFLRGMGYHYPELRRSRTSSSSIAANCTTGCS